MVGRLGLILAALTWPAKVIAAEPTLNALTKAEIADGWILLFDGQTKYGWEAENPDHNSDWLVKDGALTCRAEAGFNHLKHKAVLRDFVLKLEFRVNERGNGGVFFRGATDGVPFVGPDRIVGYEAQIDDNDPRGLLYQTGALYNVAAAKTLIKGENRWRTYEIIADGDRIITKIDGETLVDVRDDKFTHGHIGLQHHHVGNVIEFRNIRLKPLGLKPIFNGKDLAGWKTVDRPTKPGEKSLKQNWSVRDGLLHVEVPPVDGIKQGGQGQLESEATFRDFVLQLDIRTNGKHLNSGVFFRGIPGQFWIGYESQIRNQWKGDDRTQPVDFGTGGLYFYTPARTVVSNDGEFFTKTVVAAGRYFAVWINGYQASEFIDQRPENENARKGFCGNPGTIALQSHDPGTNIDFRNIRIAELPFVK
jgi:hypothetical protein